MSGFKRRPDPSFVSCFSPENQCSYAFLRFQTNGCCKSSAATLWIALQQWLLRQGKASKEGKQNKGEVAKVWLELKSSALQDLLVWQDTVILQDMLSSAAERRSILKVIHTYILDASVLSCLMAVDRNCLRSHFSCDPLQDCHH